MLELTSGYYIIGDWTLLSKEDQDKFNRNKKYLESISLQWVGGIISNMDNIQCGYYNAHSGPGTYYDNFHGEYYIPSGIVICAPIEILTHLPLEFMEHIWFPEDFSIGYENGEIKFGNYLIKT